jgi:hypothetical protein
MHVLLEIYKFSITIRAKRASIAARNACGLIALYNVKNAVAKSPGYLSDHR